MRKIVLMILLLFVHYTNDCYCGNSTNGGCFTPRGDLRVLVVYVGFGDNDTLLDVAGWPANQDRPNSALGDSAFYSDYSQFANPIDTIGDKFNISRWYYEMSGQTTSSNNFFLQ